MVIWNYLNISELTWTVCYRTVLVHWRPTRSHTVSEEELVLWCPWADVGWHVISWLAELFARLRLPDFTHYLKILPCLLTLHYWVPIRLHLPVKSSFTFASLFFSAFDEWFRLTTFQKAQNTKNKNSKTVNGNIKQEMLL